MTEQMTGATPDRRIPQTFQEVVCPKCNQHLTDARNAVIARDEKNGGLKGQHIECPKLEPVKPELVSFTKQHEELLLATARVLKASLSDVGGHYAEQDIKAIADALAPFEPKPGPAENGANS